GRGRRRGAALRRALARRSDRRRPRRLLPVRARRAPQLGRLPPVDGRRGAAAAAPHPHPRVRDPGTMKIHTEVSQLGGVWANAAAVRHSPHEFTIDFLRCDFDDNGTATSGMLVQRINMSPLFVTQLIAALQDNWSKYADKAMPKELR